jgi:cysteine desulfurase/selenocysteine lyase
MIQTMEEKEKVFDVENIRKDFPILSQTIYGKPLVYLDNAATSQKPQAVIDTLVAYYSTYNANIHRGVHFLSQKASAAYDAVRGKVQQFIHAKSEREIIFLRGTTEAINLVASAYGRKNIHAGDEIIVSAMEHHSNIVPWQMLCEEKNAVLKVIPMNDAGELLIDEFEKLLSPKTKIIAVVHTSNSLGTINPVQKICEITRAFERNYHTNIVIMVDGAQAVAHTLIDVQEMDCDFFAFSSHKMCGPTGSGVLYGKENLLNEMNPYQGGGDMISSVRFEKTTYNDVPFRFEAGTQNIADVIAMGTAIDYLQSQNRHKMHNHECALLNYATQQLSAISEVHIIGTAKNKTSVVSFVADGVNALDAGMYLDTLGIAVRTGQHCTEPVMDRLKISGTIRASFLFYNTMAEVDALVEGVKKAVKLLRK